MKLFSRAIICAVAAVLVSSCSKKNDNAVDTEYPVIDISASGAFPKSCAVIKRGESFNIVAQLFDNAELGAVSVDVHHNFDQHSHSTEVNDCIMDAKKAPVNPFLLIKTFQIPAGLKSYQLNEKIDVPHDVDPGDYHFLFRLADKQGWQTIKGISIKIQ